MFQKLCLEPITQNIIVRIFQPEYHIKNHNFFRLINVFGMELRMLLESNYE